MTNNTVPPVQHTCCPYLCDCCPDCPGCKAGVPTDVEDGYHRPVPVTPVGSTRTLPPAVLAALGFAPGTRFVCEGGSYLGEDGEWHDNPKDEE